MRASYRKAVAWIASEDEPEDLDVEAVEGYITVHLIADVFDKETDVVARAVVRKRKKTIREEEVAATM